MLPDAFGSFFYLRVHGVQVFRMCSILDFRFTERMLFLMFSSFAGCVECLSSAGVPIGFV